MNRLNDRNSYRRHRHLHHHRPQRPRKDRNCNHGGDVYRIPYTPNHLRTPRSRIDLLSMHHIVDIGDLCLLRQLYMDRNYSYDGDERHILCTPNHP